MITVVADIVTAKKQATGALSEPVDVVFYQSGYGFVSDAKRKRVFIVEMHCPVKTAKCLGSGSAGLSDDKSREATFKAPCGLHLRGDDLVADRDNGAIRVADIRPIVNKGAQHLADDDSDDDSGSAGSVCAVRGVTVSSVLLLADGVKWQVRSSAARLPL